MALSVINNFAPQNVLSTILQSDEVTTARDRIASSPSKVTFTLPLTDALRAALLDKFGLNAENIQSIPMTWIAGNTNAHIDVGEHQFDHTYIVYLTDSAGSLVLGSTEYSIMANTGYVFEEGIMHHTINTGSAPRLLIGPFNEHFMRVGASLFYYANEANALAQSTYIAYSNTYLVSVIDYGNLNGVTRWRLAANSTGSSPQNIVYNNNEPLNNDGAYFLYPDNICFLEGTLILCNIDSKDTYIPVESMRAGTLVKTSLNGYKPVSMIGKGIITNPGHAERIENRLYKCSPNQYPELTTDLYITGCHSILVNELTAKQRQGTMNALGKIYVTDRKYRLMAHLDERAEPWESAGVYNIWHFALENDDYYMNYGVYANGLLVETTSKRFMSELSNMALVN